jgi:predicted transcriptional regulator
MKEMPWAGANGVWDALPGSAMYLSGRTGVNLHTVQRALRTWLRGGWVARHRDKRPGLGRTWIYQSMLGGEEAR